MKNLLKKSKLFWTCIACLTITCSPSFEDTTVRDEPVPSDISKTIKNPLLTGSDPWVYQKDGKYYYMHTDGGSINLRVTNSVSKIASTSPVRVFTTTTGAPNSRNVWAPEIHYINSKWYIYYTAGSGTDVTQRTWVLENSHADPTQGIWIDKGRIFHPDADFWAIDGSIMEHKGSMYFLWCGRPGAAVNNLTQNIYIAKMNTPWSLEGSVTMLTTPSLSWERSGHPVNEGPQSLVSPNGKQHIVYSVSSCHTDNYALGLLTLKDNGDPMKATDWVKSQEPIFTKNVENKAFGPGHNSFFKSPDGKEDWIIYHANSNAGDGCGTKRNIRIQKISFTASGEPNLGIPVAIGAEIDVPSGEL